ncbi:MULTISPECIES: GNAT family N-acetyltransferase [unclassified Roseitalea]|uniref:GNAT family N-acetyltransferase n=1 Tax=unclassified Roseitalea TaxID=2639107 RepID=UPI00273E885C|nr:MULTISPECIES: GNAT family N-acetyltransferase [unclassified Roseitalea]
MARFRVVAGFPEALRRPAADLYYGAFVDKLGPVLGRDGRGAAFLADIMDPQFCLCAVSDDETRLFGIAGFKTAAGALAGGGLADLARHYGRFGALWRGIVLSLLGRATEQGIFLLDGIAVRPEARGNGIGTALLDAIEGMAGERGFTCVRLDVIDTNGCARALYERRGYVPVSRERLGPLGRLIGFSGATRMEKPIAPSR